MAINPSVNYPTKTAAPDANYPLGSAQNVTAPGDGTGTPLEQAWVNDLFGFFQTLLDRSGAAPSGVPDTILASDYYGALQKLFSRYTIFTDTGTANAKALAATTGADVNGYGSGGLRAGFFVNTTNTGATTAEIAALGPVAINSGGAALIGNELKAGTFVELIYNNVGPVWDLALAPPASGSVVQVVNAETGAVATGTTVIPADDTIPQITEGDEYMTRAITPTKATNRLVIEVVANVAHSAAGSSAMIGAIFQGVTVNAIAAALGGKALVADASTQIIIRHERVAGTTAAINFRFRAGTSIAGTTTFNGASGARLFGGVYASSMKITEIEA